MGPDGGHVHQVSQRKDSPRRKTCPSDSITTRIIHNLEKNDLASRENRSSINRKIVQSCRVLEKSEGEKKSREKRDRPQTRISVSVTRFSGRCIEIATRQLSNKVSRFGCFLSVAFLSRGPDNHRGPID